MKTNEAPEKLYLHPTAKGKVGASWLTFPLTNDDIEYTRTDAFVEKACDAYCRMCDTKECGDTGECLWVETFRKRLMK